MIWQFLPQHQPLEQRSSIEWRHLQKSACSRLRVKCHLFTRKTSREWLDTSITNTPLKGQKTSHGILVRLKHLSSKSLWRRHSELWGVPMGTLFWLLIEFIIFSCWTFHQDILRRTRKWSWTVDISLHTSGLTKSVCYVWKSPVDFCRCSQQFVKGWEWAYKE